MGTTRHFALGKALRAHGWQVAIIAGSAEHNTRRQRLRPGESHRLEHIDGVDFLWLRTPSYRGNGLGRSRGMVEFAARTLAHRLKASVPVPDAIIGSSPHPFGALAGCFLAQRHRVPFIYEIRDLWPQTLIDMGAFSARHPICVALRGAEALLCRRAAQIIALMPNLADYLGPRGAPADKITWLPNFADFGVFPPPFSKPQGEHFTLMYLGAHGAANGLDNLVDAMALLSRSDDGRNIRLRLVGDGPERPRLMEKAAALGLENVSFEPAVPKYEVAGLAADADALVFNLRDLPVFRYGISPNKLFDYMACGRPIVFCTNASNNPVAEAGAGISVPAERPEALAQAMLDLSRRPHDELLQMGSAGRRHVEQRYSVEIISQRLAGLLDDAVTSSGKRRQILRGLAGHPGQVA